MGQSSSCEVHPTKEDDEEEGEIAEKEEVPEKKAKKKKEPIYEMVDVQGHGRLVELMRMAHATGDYTEFDAYADSDVKAMLFNQGKGMVMPVSDLVKLRNQERNKKLGAFSRKKGKGKSGPNVLQDINQEGQQIGDLQKALKLLDGGGKGGRGESKYREMCWKLECRGEMGENVLGVCMLSGRSIHNLIVVRLLNIFPKLVNDINISEDYYGMTHAIVNHDCFMVGQILRRGADVHVRCYGAFFCPEDQKSSRADSLEHEFVELNTSSTYYTGNMYYGEYPLSFAVCTSQPEVFRLLIARKARINAQDTNGNTALHLCVIHEKMDMLYLCVEAGASLSILNKQNLSPLTLAAKLAKKKSEKVWIYADSACTAYSLTKETQAHLDLLEGLLENILEEKWKEYGRQRWILSLLRFVVYYIAFTAAFMLRPYSATTEHITKGMVSRWGVAETTSTDVLMYTNGTHPWDPEFSQCHLLRYDEWPWPQGWLRLVCEVLVVVSVLVQLLSDIKEIRQIGRSKWLYVMRAFPAKLLFKLSWILVLLAVPIRLSCSFHESLLYVENSLAAASILLTTLHFLYFLRAIPFIGPFVLMVYTIIATDLSRFFLIYPIFLMGFSQAFYRVFMVCHEESKRVIEGGKTTEFENVIKNPIDAFIRTFIMTIGEFGVLYRELSACDSTYMRYIGKGMFFVFEMCVSILQFNLLIAMMTRTYETIFLARREFKRQWAQVILMLEMSLSEENRLEHLLKYSRPNGTNKRTRSYVVKKKGTCARTEEEELLLREEKAERMREQRRQLLRKRQREHEQRVNALRVLETMVVSRKARLSRQTTII